jgi:Regulator of chromosome condensation (RCC1) repeat
VYSYIYPRRIDLGRDRTVVSVSCGYQHCCAVTDNGQVSHSFIIELNAGTESYSRETSRFCDVIWCVRCIDVHTDCWRANVVKSVAQLSNCVLLMKLNLSSSFSQYVHHAYCHTVSITCSSIAGDSSYRMALQRYYQNYYHYLMVSNTLQLLRLC